MQEGKMLKLLNKMLFFLWTFSYTLNRINYKKYLTPNAICLHDDLQMSANDDQKNDDPKKK